jgi:hypothetical protein
VRKGGRISAPLSHSTGRSLNVPGTKLVPWSITERRSEVSFEVEFPRECLVARKFVSKLGVLMKTDGY